METSITTEHKHWYMYSDAIRYFLYVPEKLRIVMNQNDYDVADVDDYYMRKLKFLQDHHFFDKDEVCFQIEYTEDLVKQNMACLRQLLIEVTDKWVLWWRTSTEYEIDTGDNYLCRGFAYS